MYEVLEVLKRKVSDEKPNRLRKQGLIPAVVYGADLESTSLQIEVKKLLKSLSAKANIYELSVEGKEKHLVSIDKVQRAPLTNNVLHVSFHKLNQNVKARVTVPIILTGKAAGAEEGGILMQRMNEVDVMGLPQDIPEALSIDVSALKVGDVILGKALQCPNGIEICEEYLNQPFAACALPRAEKETTPAEGEEGAEDGETPATEGAAPEAEEKKEEEKK